RRGRASAGRARPVAAGAGPSTSELQLVPRGDRRELEQRAPAAGVLVGELRLAVVPDDLERAALHLVVEPRASEDQLPQPVDERLALHEREPLPVAGEVAPEARLRLVDQPLRSERDEVGRLLLVELVHLDEPELHGRADDALLEVVRVEAEAVAEELDDVVVAGGVVRLSGRFRHVSQDNPERRGSNPATLSACWL